MATTWTEVDLAYFAGILDGEGCFSLKNPGNHKLSCQISVGQTDPRLAQWLVDRFGGYVYEERRPNPKHKLVFRWNTAAKDLDRILVAVMPYLVIKRDRAELMVSYRRTLYRQARRQRVSDDIKLERDEIRSKLSVLNRRGVA